MKIYPIIVTSGGVKFTFHKRIRSRRGNCFTCAVTFGSALCKSYSAQSLCHQGSCGYFWLKKYKKENQNEKK